jgi:hypothetical protein
MEISPAMKNIAGVLTDIETLPNVSGGGVLTQTAKKRTGLRPSGISFFNMRQYFPDRGE